MTGGDPLQTVLTGRLGCRLPVIQTAMGWIAEPRLVAASTEAGAFAFLAAAVMTPDEARSKIVEVRGLTAKPFGVNFHMFQPGADAIVASILEHRDRVRAVSFGRGPDAGMIARFRQAGILCIPTIGSLKHARKMADLGVDMLVVQGGEGGGHTGASPTTVLLPQVLDAVDIPVVAAGGFADGRGLAAALAYGAVGVAMGTRFLLTRDSGVPAATLERYLAAGVEDIVLTTGLDGLPHRMVRTPLVDRIHRSGPVGKWARALESGLVMKRATGASWGDLLRSATGMRAHGGLSLPQAMMAASAPTLIRRAVVEGRPDEGVMASGVVAGRITDLPTCAELLDRIEAQAREQLSTLAPSCAVEAA